MPNAPARRLRSRTCRCGGSSSHWMSGGVSTGVDVRRGMSGLAQAPCARPDPGGRGRPPGCAGYFSLAEQSLPMTLTELTRIRGALDAPDVALEVVPVVVPVARAVVDVVDPDILLSSVPVTSTRLPTFDDRSDAALSST